MPDVQHLIIAGLPRSGSTSLYTYLLQHRDICASRIKETQHFLPAGQGKPVAGRPTYEGFFSHYRAERYKLEASPSYFYGGERVARAIREQLGEVRIVLLMRHPADRLVSYYTHEIMFGNIPKEMGFEAFLESPKAAADRAVASGYYMNFLPAWHDFFPRSLRILFFDQLQADPVGLMRDLCVWLEIDGGQYVQSELGPENRGAIYRNKRLHMFARAVNTRFETFLRRHLRLKHHVRGLYYRLNEAKEARPAVRPEVRSRLLDEYRPHNEQLYRFMEGQGYPISGWLAAYAPRRPDDPDGVRTAS